MDELAPAARALRSVNTVAVTDDGGLIGHSTDGDGFVAAMAEAGCALAGAVVAVVGAGAAARSVIDAVGRAGAGEIVVINRTPERAEDAVRLASTARTGSIENVSAADLVVNATSVGLDSDEVPFDPRLVRPGQVVADLVYHPLETRLLAAARERRCEVVDGLSMLVHQAVLQQELWTGRRPDPEVMRAAGLAELIRRRGVA